MFWVWSLVSISWRFCIFLFPGFGFLSTLSLISVFASCLQLCLDFFCIVIFSQRITAKSLFLSLVLFPRWVHALPATRWFYNSRQSVSPVSSSLSSSPLQPNCFSFTSSSALQFCTCAPFTQVTTIQGFTAACAYIPTRVSCWATMRTHCHPQRLWAMHSPSPSILRILPVWCDWSFLSDQCPGQPEDSCLVLPCPSCCLQALLNPGILGPSVNMRTTLTELVYTVTVFRYIT